MSNKAMGKAGWLLLGLCGACSQANQEQETARVSTAPAAAVAPVPAPADHFLDSTWFKMARLDTFRIAYRPDPELGLDWGEKKLVKLTAAQERRFLPDKPKHQKEKPFYFYSLQQNTPERQEITVISDDGEYLLNLLRLVYDARHQLVSHETVASFGADGGQMLEAYGRFESPTQFRLTTVQTEVSGEDSVATTEEIDSTVTILAVRNDKFQQLRQQHFPPRHKRVLLPTE
jgi:hypothetical protein